MSFDPAWLLISMIPSAAGVALLAIGKKQGRWVYIVAGALLVVYPMFTGGLLALVVTGAVIGLGLWYAVRMGW